MFKRNKRRKQGEPRSPLTVTPVGTGLVFKNNATADQHLVMQRELRDRYPAVVAEIDGLVAKIAAQVAELPPEQLLQHAWWATAQRRMDVKVESEVNFNDGVAQRMLDYVQSVIASVPRAPVQRALEEVDWETLAKDVETLFFKVNLELPICSTAHAQLDPTFDENIEEFKVKAQMYWCNVRGHQGS